MHRGSTDVPLMLASEINSLEVGIGVDRHPCHLYKYALRLDSGTVVNVFLARLLRVKHTVSRSKKLSQGDQFHFGRPTENSLVSSRTLAFIVEIVIFHQLQNSHSAR